MGILFGGYDRFRCNVHAGGPRRFWPSPPRKSPVESRWMFKMQERRIGCL